METKQINDLVNASYFKVRDILTELPITCHHSKSRKFMKKVNSLMCNKTHLTAKVKNNPPKLPKQNKGDLKVEILDKTTKPKDKKESSIKKKDFNTMDTVSITHCNNLFPTDTHKTNTWKSFEEVSITDWLAVDLTTKDNTDNIKYAPEYKNSFVDIFNYLKIDTEEIKLRFKICRQISKDKHTTNFSLFHVSIINRTVKFNDHFTKLSDAIKLYERAKFLVTKFYELNKALIRQIREVQRPPLKLKLNFNIPKTNVNMVENDASSSDSTMKQIKLNYTLLESNIDDENEYPALDYKFTERLNTECNDQKSLRSQANSDDDSNTYSINKNHTYNKNSESNDDFDEENSNQTYTILNYDESDDEKSIISLSQSQSQSTYTNTKPNETFNDNFYEYSTQSRNEKLFNSKGDVTPQPSSKTLKRNETFNMDINSSQCTNVICQNQIKQHHTYPPTYDDYSQYSHTNKYYDVNASYKVYNRESSYLPNNNYNDNYMNNYQIDSYNYPKYRSTCSYNACNCTPKTNMTYRNQMYQQYLMSHSLSSINCGCNSQIECPFRYPINNTYNCPCYNEQYNKQVTYNQITYKQRYY